VLRWTCQSWRWYGLFTSRDGNCKLKRINASRAGRQTYRCFARIGMRGGLTNCALVSTPALIKSFARDKIDQLLAGVVDTDGYLCACVHFTNPPRRRPTGITKEVLHFILVRKMVYLRVVDLFKGMNHRHVVLFE